MDVVPQFFMMVIIGSCQINFNILTLINFIMNYRQFNYNVYSYYLENLIPGEFNTLTIPKSDFEDIIQDEENIKNFNEIKIFDWSLLLNYDDSIPKYFGLLALQCYATFYMQNDGRLTSANFRDRFITITGIASTQNLNQRFSETYNNQLNIQEKIWLHAKTFLEKKSIFLELPKPKSHAGRYTQFPESQCVLNYEDLKEEIKKLQSKVEELEKKK